MKNRINSNFAIAILALVTACVGFSFWFLGVSVDSQLPDSNLVHSQSKKFINKQDSSISVKDLDNFTCDTPEIPLQNPTDALCFQLEKGFLDLAKGGIKLDSVDVEISDFKWVADVSEVDSNWQVRITSSGPILPSYSCEVTISSQGENTSPLTAIPCGYNK